MKISDNESTFFNYRGEGAANIVLSYHGENPLYVGKVLRVKKTTHEQKDGNFNGENGVNKVLPPEERFLWSDWPEISEATCGADLAHNFAKKVMIPHLGSQFVDPGIPVTLSKEFLEEVNSRITPKRPKKRVEKGGIEPKISRAILIEDHTIFSKGSKEVPTICVEIKPKCGFLPPISSISPANEVKARVSRFALHQKLKFFLEEVHEVSEYNPLDLFSGQPKKISHAMESLFETPQNNLRFFKDGKELTFRQIHQKTSPETENFPEIRKSQEEHLDQEMEDFFPGLPNGQRSKKLLEVVGTTLLESGVLQNLLECQKIENSDIESAFPAFIKFHAELAVTAGQDRADVAHHAELAAPDSIEECRKKIQNFLISATAKDCGLMISFRPIGDKEEVPAGSWLLAGGLRFEYKVKFVDLDMKPYRKIPSYYELDKKIVQHYNMYHSGE